ncbi:MAG: sugar ABC transporter ATP-binding protein, partial [Mesorhizobium sp.]
RPRTLAAPLLKRVGANFSADTPVSTLSLAQQQMVEIAKALSIEARLVILDEPTSSLPLAETDKLLDVIRALKAEGISVIFISHRLHEVERVADRVVVLRDALSAKAIRTSAYPDRPVDLGVRQGEILGLAGLVGSGRTELARVLFGIATSLGGALQLDGKDLVLGSAADAVANGIFLV